MTLKNKKVFVTGGDGFIGSHLVEHLYSEGCRVKALSFYNSFNNWGWLDKIPKKILKGIEVVSGDVRDYAQMMKLIKGEDIVFHLAALIAIPYSYLAPQSFVETNVTGTLNVLLAAQDAGCEKILTTSTSEVYGTAKYVPINEDHPLQAQSVYAATKIAADKLTESFYKSYSLPAVIVRPFNTYGPRQSARAVIATIITQLLSGQVKIKLGDLSPTRDFVFVEDTVSGFAEIARSDQTIGEVINIATGKEISVAEVFRELATLINPHCNMVEDKQRLRPDLSEVSRLCGANDKIMKLTRWKPMVSFAEGLQKTVAWFSHKENLELYKPGIYNI